MTDAFKAAYKCIYLLTGLLASFVFDTSVASCIQLHMLLGTDELKEFMVFISNSAINHSHYDCHLACKNPSEAL